jgi:hypothetical protein
MKLTIVLFLAELGSFFSFAKESACFGSLVYGWFGTGNTLVPYKFDILCIWNMRGARDSAGVDSLVLLLDRGESRITAR